ncbi:MAG: hypothetical protein V3W52_02565 [Syntrophobacteria bacterium]
MGKPAFMADSKHFVDLKCKVKLYHRPPGLSGIDPRGWRWESAMARRGQHSFMKRQKERKRKQKALDKMARRQGKIEQATDVDEEELTERQEEQDEEEAD